jgi:hypothetical protein
MNCFDTVMKHWKHNFKRRNASCDRKSTFVAPLFNLRFRHIMVDFRLIIWLN